MAKKKSQNKSKKTAAKAASKKKAAKAAPKKSAKKTVKKTAKKSAAKSAPAKRTASKPAAGPRGSALQSVAPGLTANDAAASIKWYCDVLGFTVKQRWEHEGQFLGAEISSGNVQINIGQDDWKMGRDRAKGQGTRMYINMGPDIDAFADRIKANGGVLDSEPMDTWGLRAFSINDPDGFKLTFMTSKK